MKREAFLRAVGFRVRGDRGVLQRPANRWRDREDQLIRVAGHRKANPCIHFDPTPTSQKCGIGTVYKCALYGLCSFCTRSVRQEIQSCVQCPSYIVKPPPTLYHALRRSRAEPLIWSVGVTTAPRAISDHRWDVLARQRGWSDEVGKHAIDWTLRSIDAAGFPAPTVFAEPGSHRPESGYAQWLENPQQLGAWQNWRKALQSLIDQTTDGGAILLAQDDVILCRGVRELLDNVLWPENTGVVSLYCSGKYASGKGVFTVSVGGGFWGACALVFSKEAAKDILASRIPERYSGNRIDNRVGRWCLDTKRNLWLFSPSLAQHIGEYRSTLNHGGGGGMAAADFVGESFDAMSLLTERDTVKPPIAVAIPVFGCGKQVVECIRSIAQHVPEKSVVLWLVDNAGPPDDFKSAVLAADLSGLAYEVVKNSENRGFTAAVNQVIQANPTADVLVLNSDAYLTGDVPGILAANLAREPHTGVVAAMEYRLSGVGPNNDIRRMPGVGEYVRRLPDDASGVAAELATKPRREYRSKVSYVCVLLRREALDAVGPLDERLVSGLGADDLHCEKMIAAGWDVAVATDALVIHEGSASFTAASLPRADLQSAAMVILRDIRSAEVVPTPAPVDHDKAPMPFPITRSLMYHVAAFTWNDYWARNLASLFKHLEIFNGKRAVAVAAGENLHDPDPICELFRRRGCETFIVQNNPKLREQVSFRELLTRVASRDQETAVWFGHTKGTTFGSRFMRSATRCSQRDYDRWRLTLYARTLDNWQECMQALTKKLCVGPYRCNPSDRRNSGGVFADYRNKFRWHYAGTFFWVRADNIFPRPDWFQVPQKGWAVEGYLGNIFSVDMSACTGFDNWSTDEPKVYGDDLYDDGGHEAILQEWEAIKR